MRRKRAFYDNPGIRKAAQRKEAMRRSLSAEAKPVDSTEVAAGSAAASSNGGEPHAPAARKWTVQATIAVALLAITLPLPIVRATGLIGLHWALAILPLAIVGFVFVLANVLSAFAGRFTFVRNLLFGREQESGSGTPPPERLQPPLSADAIGDSILAEHPELLAALCLGFRMKKFVPNVLGKPVTDPWAVYNAALLASSFELQQVKVIARMHFEAYSNHPKSPRKHGQKLSDAELMRHAVEHFRRCADKTTKKGGNADCPYEHVVVVFASRAPSRDAQLRSIAPRVRSMLEHQYPQMRTASLAGQDLSFTQWQKQALLDRQELDRERKERERTARKLTEATAEAAQVRDEIASLRASVDAARDEARNTARTEQARIVEDLRTAIERAAFEHNREIQRVQADLQKHIAQLTALTAERDELERALFSHSEEDDDPGGIDPQIVSGLRVLLLGGDARQARPVREYAESVGIQLLHEDSVNATTLVESVDMVVFWIRYLGHPKYFVVRRECRVRGTPHCYWTRTSPPGLVSLIARARSGKTTLTD